jgi:hypothetical protein
MAEATKRIEIETEAISRLLASTIFDIRFQTLLNVTLM